MANEHLADPVRLRALFDQEGYLFFRDVLDRDAVLAAGRVVIRTLVEQGLVQRLPLAGADDTRLQDALNEQQLWERLVTVPSAADFFTKVAGGPVRFIPLARYRVMAPGSATLVHQDALLNPGFAMTTAWIPLMATDAELGGLAVAAGSHRQGCIPLEALPPLDDVWRSAVYEPGDVVLMHEALVHSGLANRTSDGVRLSIDVRFQNPGAPAALVGRISAVDAASVRIEGDDGEAVTLGVDDSTLLRSSTGQRIPLAELTASELAPGQRVIASQWDGRAVMVKPL